MTARFLQTLFTDSVKAAQSANGSRSAMARLEAQPIQPDVLTLQEAGFISQRDSFYLASQSESGWPYIQHRGGPAGFVRVLDASTLAFADFRGNRQYVSVGNLSADNRACLFFMDYANRTRLKLLGRVHVVTPEANPELVAALNPNGYGASVERALVVTVEAFDWNCPQHITPRFTADLILPEMDRLRARIAELEAENAAFRSGGPA